MSKKPMMKPSDNDGDEMMEAQMNKPPMTPPAASFKGKGRKMPTGAMSNALRKRKGY